MIDRPSSGMGLDELREEFDWMFEFQSRMAEKIRGDADVHNLVDYVGKLESENVALREKAQRQADELTALRKAIEQRNGEWRPWKRQAERFVAENAKLRELAVGMYGMLEMFDTLLGNHDACETPRPLVFGEDKSFKDTMRELGLVNE